MSLILDSLYCTVLVRSTHTIELFLFHMTLTVHYSLESLQKLFHILYRYLLAEIIYENEKLNDTTLTSTILYRAIKDAIGMLYGDYGLSCIASSLTGTVKLKDFVILNRRV